MSMNSNEIKLIIIENFIDWYTTDENERGQMKEDALIYVEEDHVDEVGEHVRYVLKQAYPQSKK